MRLLRAKKKRQSGSGLTVSSSQGQRTARKATAAKNDGTGLLARLGRRLPIVGGKGGAKPPRRGKKPFWRLRNCARATAVLSVALLLGGGVWLWQDGWVGRQVTAAVDSFQDFTATAGLKVQDLQVVGRNRTAPDEILAALSIERGMPMLQIDPQAAKEKLEALTWIKEAAVERRFPNVVAVTLSEREPIAIWQQGDNLSLIDRDGTVIQGVPIQRFASLPLVVGDGAPAQTAKLLSILETEPSLMPRVAAAIWVTERRWNLKLDNGIQVKLPEDDPADAWAQLARYEQEQGVLNRDVINIDMRIPNRWVVQRAPDARLTTPDKNAGENT
ncbi:MAG TPA: cell division protein FtsQ/DivIB [Kiloniellaceae bacterium]|nr:cell division protein FtsQ/DivIB [Kiloniellaceae bacterium]